MTKVITYGTYDLLHQGHWQLFRDGYGEKVIKFMIHIKNKLEKY